MELSLLLYALVRVALCTIKKKTYNVENITKFNTVYEIIVSLLRSYPHFRRVFIYLTNSQESIDFCV